jgi:homoserine dehydrogenase
MLKVGIIGVGTVGTSVVNILRDNKNIITARAGVEIVPTIGVVSNLNKQRDVQIELTDDVSKVLEDDSIDIVVELMGGITRSVHLREKHCGRFRRHNVLNLNL